MDGMLRDGSNQAALELLPRLQCRDRRSDGQSRSHFGDISQFVHSGQQDATRDGGSERLKTAEEQAIQSWGGQGERKLEMVLAEDSDFWHCGRRRLRWIYHVSRVQPGFEILA